MSNEVSDPGFELGVEWTYSTKAVRSTARPYSGTYSARLHSRKGAGPDWTSYIISNVLDLIVGEKYIYTFWYYNPPSADTGLNVYVDKGTGYTKLPSHLDGRALIYPTVPGEWVFGEYDFIATGTTGKVKLESSSAATSIYSDYWYIDDVSVEWDVAAKRKAIKAALVSQLANITQANGYNVDLDTVYDEATPENEMTNFPSIVVVYGQELKRTHEMHGRIGAIDFFLGVRANDAAADDTCDDLCADIEKCLETQASGQYIGLSYVRNIETMFIRPDESVELLRDGTRLWVVGVRVDYRYTRTQP